MKMVPEVGIEPTWDCSRQILSLVRIPISPLRREVSMIRRGLREVKSIAGGDPGHYLSTNIAGTGFSPASPNALAENAPSELRR